MCNQFQRGIANQSAMSLCLLWPSLSSRSCGALCVFVITISQSVVSCCAIWSHFNFKALGKLVQSKFFPRSLKQKQQQWGHWDLHMRRSDNRSANVATELSVYRYECSQWGKRKYTPTVRCFYLLIVVLHDFWITECTYFSLSAFWMLVYYCGKFFCML